MEKVRYDKLLAKFRLAVDPEKYNGLKDKFNGLLKTWQELRQKHNDARSQFNNQRSTHGEVNKKIIITRIFVDFPFFSLYDE